MQQEIRNLQQEKQGLHSDMTELQDRLVQFALQAPSNSASLLDDAIADLADKEKGGSSARAASSAGKPLNTQQEAVIAEVWGTVIGSTVWWCVSVLKIFG